MFAMMECIPELILTPQCPTQEELGITLIREAECPVKLDGPISRVGESIAPVCLGHAQGGFCMLNISDHGGGVIQM